MYFIKKLFRFLQWQLFLRKNSFDKNSWYFITGPGIGDTYQPCSIIPYLIEEGDSVTVIVLKKSHLFIPKLFSNLINVVYLEDVPYNLIKEFSTFSKRNLIFLHPDYLLNGSVLKLIGYKSTHLMDAFRLMLGVNYSNKPVLPLFKQGREESVLELFHSNDIPIGKTVLLCPGANSVKALDNQFWLSLAETLENNGLTPVFMGEQSDFKFKSISFSLEDAKFFCDYAGSVISLRSGFCDLIATSTAKKIIIYPDVLWLGGTLFEASSLIEMNLAESVSTLEIVYCESDTNFSLYSKTLNFLK